MSFIASEEKLVATKIKGGVLKVVVVVAVLRWENGGIGEVYREVGEERFNWG